jgi:hypothetical protein
MRPSLPIAFRYSVLALTAVVLVPATHACATCFGRSDSALAEGMNMGILVLLGVILSVLCAFAAFILYLSRRAALLAAGPVPPGAASSAAALP